MVENALRHLQIFRNGAIITGKTSSQIKASVEAALDGGTLILHDGEPISIRYIAPDDLTNTVKGLMGVAYIKGDTKQVLWTGNDITIDTTPKEGYFVTLTHTNDGEGNFQLAVNYKTVELADVTSENDGLAIASDIKGYIYDYRVAKDDDTLTWTLQRKALGSDKWEDVAEAWTIDSELVVESGTVKYLGKDVNGKNPGEEGYNETEGTDAYLVLKIRNQDKPVYIKATDLVDVYTAGSGIDIDSKNVVSINLGTSGNVKLSFNEDNKLVANFVEYNGGNGIAIDEKHNVTVDLSTETGNILEFKDGKLFAQLGASTAISDIQVTDNTTDAAKYYTVDATGKIVEDTTTEHTGAFEVPANTKMLLVATEDKKINGVILPETEDTYVKSGELVEIAATETKDAKTVIRLSYNTNKTPIDVDVTDLVNTSHTTVEGETVITGANTDYVYVHAETNDNVVTLTSGVKTVELNNIPSEWTYWTGYKVEDLVVGNAVASRSGITDGWSTVTVDGYTLYLIENDVQLNAYKDDFEDDDDTFECAVKNDIPSYYGLATAVDVKNYVDSHETIVKSTGNSVNIKESVNNKGAHVYDVTVKEAVVERNLGSDSLDVTTTGTLNQDAMAVIENYIDNYDCGTFEFADNEMAGALNNTLSNAGNGENNATNVNDNISVASNDGTINISNNNN